MDNLKEELLKLYVSDQAGGYVRLDEEGVGEILALFESYVKACKPEKIKNLNTDDSVTDEYEEMVADKLQHKSNLTDKIDGYNQAIEEMTSNLLKELKG